MSVDATNQPAPLFEAGEHAAMTETPDPSPNPHKVPYEHYCQHPGCTKWGSLGFDRIEKGEKVTDWYCFEHKGDGY